MPYLPIEDYGVIGDLRTVALVPSGAGYLLVTDRGRVVARGDAVARGDVSTLPLNGPTVALVLNCDVDGNP